MSELIFPKNYDPKLSQRETQRAIKLIKDTFQKELARELNLDRVTAPIIVKQSAPPIIPVYSCCPIRFNGLPVSDERCGQFG